MKELTEEEKKAKVQNFRPIDDVFFEVLAQNKGVCEEMLRTILEDNELIVEDVIVQSSERNIYGRSVRLDALCTLKNGTKCNIEVQRSDNDNHLKRARYNASMITARSSQPGTNFENVIDLYIVYISEFDFLESDKTIYHIEKTIRETGTVINDGLHEIFVNTTIDDGTDIAELMSCLTKKEVKNIKFPKLSAEVKRLKETEGGVEAVCKIMEEYENIAVKKDRHERIKAMIYEGLKKDLILKIGYTEEEYEEAEKSILQCV